MLARTTPLEQVKRKTEGLSLFYTETSTAPRGYPGDRQDGPPRRSIPIRCSSTRCRCLPPIVSGRKGRAAPPARHKSGAHSDCRRGGGDWARGAAQSVALCARRVVFRRPIGQNQAIAHPLAQCWMALEAANLMAMKAATLYDRNTECAVEANAAKYLAAEAAFHACETAVMTHGGMGYRRNFTWSGICAKC